MLNFVGAGVDQSLTEREIEVLKNCDRIFYESYTSPTLDENRIERFSDSLGGKKIDIVSRDFVEDGREIIELAKKSRVSLISSGDPLIATTHQDLRIRLLKENVDVTVLHGSSIITSAIGELGLHIYNFGKIVTMTREPMQYTAYETIFNNLLRGLHTMILLEWDAASDFFLSPNAAMAGLEDAERDLAYGIISQETWLLCASRVGEGASQKITASSFKEEKKDFGPGPHVIVLPGKLHFTERDALSSILGLPTDSLPDNASRVQRTSKRMLSKYSQKTLDALQRAKKSAGRENRKLLPVFENVEAYSHDAIRFLNEGKEELAILSIGYAEGLLDSLRFAGILEFEW